MATPKGGTIREYSQAALARITGQSPDQQAQLAIPKRGAPPAIGAQARAADDAKMRAAFAPPNGWFPSGMPLRPSAPAGSTTGRAYDFQPYGNLAYQPRTEQGETGISFQTLRRMASPADGGLDLLRLAIETRKDQMVAQRWSIRGKGGEDDGGPKARQFEKWIRRPDGVHTFRQWMRMFLEDHFVIDAPTIYFTETDDRPLWEIIDGATIKRLITAEDGRTPLPPLPAYQQILHGIVAENYTLDELGYYPYNVMSNRLYGISRVEQVITHVNMAINRSLSQLSFFTEGTVPDAFMELPATFTLEQVQQWTEWYNSILTGQLGERRKINFVLAGSNYKPTKDAVLKDTFDEWLARIICYDFSLSPQALVKETNRATAETSKEAAQEEGLEPTKLGFKDAMDDILERADAEDLEWWWEDEEIVDPAVKATVIMSYYGGQAGTAKPIITLEEARELGGFPPATPDQMKELQPEPEPAPELLPSANGNGNGNGHGPAPDPAANGNGKNGNGEPKAGKVFRKAGRAGGRSLRPLTRNDHLAQRTTAALEKVAVRVLTAQRDRLAHAARNLPARAAKKTWRFWKTAENDLQALLDALGDGTAEWDDETRQEVRALIQAVAEERAGAAVAQVSDYVGDDEDLARVLRQANENAVSWAEDRVGNLITGVSNTTRDVVNELVAGAVKNGWSNAQLADEISGDFGFSADRASMIARTETATAETQGTLVGYRESGVVEGKMWSADELACDDCSDLDGEVVGLDDEFSDGSDGPPAHPQCRCLIAPYVGELAAAAA